MIMFMPYILPESPEFTKEFIKNICRIYQWNYQEYQTEVPELTLIARGGGGGGGAQTEAPHDKFCRAH